MVDYSYALARLSGVLIGLTIVIATAPACGQRGNVVPQGPPSSGKGRLSVEDLKAFDKFPVYWMGEKYQGEKITAIVHGSQTNDVTIIYGTCVAKSDQGCSTPHSMTTESGCMVAPETSPITLNSVRGAPSRHLAHFEVQAGDVHVTVFTPNERDMAERMVPANTAAFTDLANVTEGSTLPGTSCRY